MFAKRFFYVCAGILCLAFAYHLGARNARAQSGVTLDGANVNLYGGVTAVLGRTFWSTTGPAGEGVAQPHPIPGTSRVVATGPASTSGGFQVLLENGDRYYTISGNENGPWQPLPNLVGAATQVRQDSWGSVKARYRGERQQPATEGR